MFFAQGNLTIFATEEIDLLTTPVHGYLGAYEDGYTCGLTWPDKWETHGKPGGPYMYTYDGPRYGHILGTLSDLERKELAARTKMENGLWRDGWEEGHNRKLNEGRSNPLRGHIHED